MAFSHFFRVCFMVFAAYCLGFRAPETIGGALISWCGTGAFCLVCSLQVSLMQIVYTIERNSQKKEEKDKTNVV